MENQIILQIINEELFELIGAVAVMFLASIIINRKGGHKFKTY